MGQEGLPCPLHDSTSFAYLRSPMSPRMEKKVSTLEKYFDWCFYYHNVTLPVLFCSSIYCARKKLNIAIEAIRKSTESCILDVLLWDNVRHDTIIGRATLGNMARWKIKFFIPFISERNVTWSYWTVQCISAQHRTFSSVISKVEYTKSRHSTVQHRAVQYCTTE